MPTQPSKSLGSAMPEFLEASKAPGCVQVPPPVRATPHNERAEMRVGAWAYTRGNRYVEQTASWVPLAEVLGIVPKDWHGGEYNAEPVAVPRVVSKRVSGDRVAARTTTYRFAAMAHLDLDTLERAELFALVRATVERVGQRRWRHAGAYSRAVMIAETVDAPYTVKAR